MKNDCTKHYSSKQEHSVASYLGWKVVTGSGARDCHPGDIVSDGWMGECKTHMSPGHKITFLSSVWHKIAEEASSKFKYPALFVDDGSQKLDNTWCMFFYKSVSPSDSQLVDYPYHISKNISFDNDKMKSFLRDYSDKNVILVTKLDDTDVGVCSLRTFFNMFGD